MKLLSKKKKNSHGEGPASQCQWLDQELELEDLKLKMTSVASDTVPSDSASQAEPGFKLRGPNAPPAPRLRVRVTGNFNAACQIPIDSAE